MLSFLRRCPSLLVHNSPLKCLPTLNLPTLAPATSVRQYWHLTDASIGPTSGDNKCGKYPQKSIYRKDPFDARHEMFKDGHGVVLYDLHDGERKNLTAVVARFKRLDWGAWIRPRAGRNKKRWKKNTLQLNDMEKHVFCKPYHKRRFDRAVTGEIKEQRHIPDDPYKVYNDMSWQHYHSTKLKNMELIKKYGPTNYNFPHHVAHPRLHRFAYDQERAMFYEPPGYHKDIHDGDGVYRPDPGRPQDIMPPDYMLVERHQSNNAKTKEKRLWRQMRRLELFSGPLPLTNRLRLPVVGTKTG